MKTAIYIFLTISSFLLVSHTSVNKKAVHVDKTTTKLDSCYYKGKALYGKVKLVQYESQADITAKIVTSFPDLKVKFIESFPDDCGEWQVVEYGEDLKIYITENFPDIKIQPVTSFPGLP